MDIIKCFCSTHFAAWNVLVFGNLLHFCELVEYEAILILRLSVFGATRLDNSLADLIDVSNGECIHKDIDHLPKKSALHVSSLSVNELQILQLSFAL
jgi:hypothetical protein